jgi:hypothetical protein
VLSASNHVEIDQLGHHFPFQWSLQEGDGKFCCTAHSIFVWIRFLVNESCENVLALLAWHQNLVAHTDAGDVPM